MAATNGEPPADGAEDIAKRAPEGIVLPPRTVRTKIEKVAVVIARNGKAFEDKIRTGTQANLTPFLEPDDEYNAYYKWRVDECKAGRSTEQNVPAAKTDVSFQGRESRAPKPPEEFKFSARMPNISAQDLDIVKLTALYAAKNGRSWVTHLSQREGGNYQFDFLRPQHSLNMFFNRLVEQYKDLIEGETAENGAPQKKRVEELQKNVNNRFNVLERAKKRAEYVKYQEKQKVEKEEKAEHDRVAFAQIDWHDFSVIATITFDERDEQADMPPPRTLNDMLSLSLEEKANMRIDPNRRLEEAVPDLNDYEDFYGQQPQYPAAQVMPQQQAYTPQPSMQPTPPQQMPYAPPIAPTLAEERDAARSATKAAHNQPTRIRNDYVPQAQLRNRTQNTSICPNCKQAIPNNELEDHMRIELLDPRWRDESRKAQQRSSTTNLSTVDVANNLKRLASQRTDVFDPITGQAVTPEEQERRKRAELQAFDGVSQLPQTAVPGTFPPGTDRTDVQEQIRQLHERYKR